MKKLLVCLIIAAAIGGLSCKSGPKIEGEVTQDKVNTALGTIYDTYRPKLDLTGAKEYVVVKGDTLSQITKQFYGSLTGVGDAGPNNGYYFPVIMLASGNKIVDPDLIEPGLKLLIPDLKKNLGIPSAHKAIKDCLIDVAYVYNKKGVAATEDGLRKLAASL